MKSTYPISRSQLESLFRPYADIDELLEMQPEHVLNMIYQVDDASADPSLTFPTGADKVAYYKYNGVAGSPASIADYTLISAPYGIVTNKDRIMATSGDITKADFGKIIYTTGTSITAAIDVSVNMLPESFECFFYNDNATTDLTFTFEPVAGWTFPTALTLQPKGRCALVRVGDTQTLKLIGND